MRVVLAYSIALTMAVVMLAGCQMQTQRGSRMQMVLQAAPDKAHPWPKSAAAQRKLMAEARGVVRARLRSVQGVSDPDVSLDGNDRLMVRFASVSPNTATVLSILTSAAELEFYWLKDVQSSNNPLGKWRIGPASDDGYEFTGPTGQVIDSRSNPKAVLEQVVGVAKNKPILTGRDLLPNTKANINQRNQIVVNIQFNESGTRIFREFTRAHVGEIVAVFFDGRLMTAPSISEAIPGGEAEITGFKSLREARDAAEMLNSGTLPVRLKVAVAK